jgi:hypothetical protein
MSTHQRIKRGTTRWFRIVDGVIQRRTVKPGEQPPPNYQRGMGFTHNEEHRQQTSSRFRGQPKTPQQLERMRQAKLGVEKSPEHRLAMSEAHKARHRLVHAIMEECAVTWNEACHILKARRDANK